MLPLAEQKLRFLVVEDSSFFRSAVSSMLNSFGINDIDVAQNGNQALDSCRSHHYDVILCDFNLGKGKNGHQLLEALRHFKLITTDTLFMMLTADTSRQAVLASSECAADDYLTKPINAVVLERRLIRAIRSHQTFKPVTAALEQNNTELAIALLERLCHPEQRLASQAKKLLGDVLLQADKFDEADTYFQCILEEKPVEWARLGQAHTFMGKTFLERACEAFHSILQDNPLCLAAYDGLASIYHQQKDYANLQTAIASAVKASPLSILRQKNLANIAEENGDIGTAIEALRECVRLGMHSCHGDWQDAYRLGINTADAPQALLATKDLLPQEALKSLKAATDFFHVNGDDLLRVQFVQGRLQYLSRQQLDGEKTISKAESRYLAREKNDVKIDIDHIKAIRTLKKNDQAQALTQALAEQYADNEAALAQLDAVMDEPQNKTNKRLLAEANKEGIALYDNQEFDEAILCFQRAQVLFPRHLGLQMNICQAYIGKHKRGDTGDLEHIIDEQLNHIRAQIKPQDAQYERFNKLQRMARL
ncbi:tetratricopeptide repeat-containing response regulator [Marinagarivorans algicola]|uniref:tetratricopeptide repeat-containing response regulator n=1 Tax=Marinagarivorans algicola TaxID=1513270 RepID=UPI0006B9394A|nr:tetratricopeptide repeat-containing response regulator [Marinagarivorans algicola]